MQATSRIQADPGNSRAPFDAAVRHGFDALAPILRALNPDPIFLIRGSASFIQSGAQARLQALPTQSLAEHLVGANPQRAHLESLYDQYRAKRHSCILAIGGGSVMDYAKVIKLWATRDNPEDPPPLCVVPTCFGSGAEVTPFSTVYEGQRKTSIADPVMKPNHIIIEPSFGRSLSFQQRAVGALDAFCQGLESYWSLRATKESRSLSLQAMLALSQGQWLCNPHQATLESLIRGAHLSGRAITTAKTTAAHALSYGLTARMGIPHGQAVAMMMIALLRSNCSAPPFSCPILESQLGFGLSEVQSRLQTILDKAGLHHPSSSSTSDQDAEHLVALVNQERLANHPWPLSPRDCLALYRSVLSQKPSS